MAGVDFSYAPVRAKLRYRVVLIAVAGFAADRRKRHFGSGSATRQGSRTSSIRPNCFKMSSGGTLGRPLRTDRLLAAAPNQRRKRSIPSATRKAQLTRVRSLGIWPGGSHCQATFFALYPSRAHVGPVAQRLEPAAHNGLVAGSNPARPTTKSSSCLNGLQGLGTYKLAEYYRSPPFHPLERFPHWKALHDAGRRRRTKGRSSRAPASPMWRFPE